MDAVKYCAKCKTEKPASSFYASKRRAGLQSNCKDCKRIAYEAGKAEQIRRTAIRRQDPLYMAREYEGRKRIRAANPEAARAREREYRAKPGFKIKQRDAAFRCRYGISLAEAERRLAEQGGRCRICSKEIEFGRGHRSDCAHIDHSHLSGVARGVLCPMCNKAIGLLYESSEVCRRAAEYLDTHAEGREASPLGAQGRLTPE